MKCEKCGKEIDEPYLNRINILLARTESGEKHVEIIFPREGYNMCNPCMGKYLQAFAGYWPEQKGTMPDAILPDYKEDAISCSKFEAKNNGQD